MEIGRNTTGAPQAITKGTTTRIIMPTGDSPPPKPEKKPRNPHKGNGFSYGVVYANDLAKSEIEKEKPNFPQGAMIVRERNLTKTSEKPETVIAMVKREKGFSKKTGDWEFFIFDGKDLALQKRETRGSCAECHSNVKKTDWVFREYLK